MKKLDTLKKKDLKPKKETVDFLLSFSRSTEVLKIKQKNILISKN